MVDNASDLHITKNSPLLVIRLDGNLVKLKTEPFNGDDTKRVCYSILTDSQKAHFEENQELDMSFGLQGLARFRANIFVQQGAVAGAFRVIPWKIRSFNELGLPPVVEGLTKKPRGLILVTGPTGLGQVDHARRDDRQDQHRKNDHAPHRDHRRPRSSFFTSTRTASSISQREVGSDTQSFKKALKSMLASGSRRRSRR